MSTAEKTMKDEDARQLRAAAEGRFKQTEVGRYVIDGEPCPDRKTREKLIRWEFLTRQFDPKTHKVVGLKITAEGETALRLMAPEAA